jgi:hypothetical protein
VHEHEVAVHCVFAHVNSESVVARRSRLALRDSASIVVRRVKDGCHTPDVVPPQASVSVRVTTDVQDLGGAEFIQAKNHVILGNSTLGSKARVRSGPRLINYSQVRTIPRGEIS